MSEYEHDAQCERVYTVSGYTFIDCLCGLRKAQAEAWDEGATRVWQSLAEHAWTLEFYTDDNPYRAAQVAPSRVPGEES